MIAQVKGRLAKVENSRVILEISGIFYEIAITATVATKVNALPLGSEVELVTYHYYNIDQNRGYPVLIGFNNELERDFFEKFISVSGVGPRAALKAFIKPVAQIAAAIEEGDLKFLQSLSGIGSTRAKQIIAQLQGKVGRFTLVKDTIAVANHKTDELADEAKQILKRLGYSTKEIDQMIADVAKNDHKIESIEEFLNEIYRQKKLLS